MQAMDSASDNVFQHNTPTYVYLLISIYAIGPLCSMLLAAKLTHIHDAHLSKN